MPRRKSHKPIEVPTEHWIRFMKRIVTPCCEDIRAGYGIPKVLLWTYLQGMYDAMQTIGLDAAEAALRENTDG